MAWLFHYEADYTKVNLLNLEYLLSFWVINSSLEKSTGILLFHHCFVSGKKSIIKREAVSVELETILE